MICPEELAVMVNAVAIATAQDKSVEQIEILSAVFTQIGDTLATIATQKANIELCLKKNNKISK